MVRRHSFGIIAVWSSPFCGHGKSSVLLNILKASPLKEKYWVQCDKVFIMLGILIQISSVFHLQTLLRGRYNESSMTI